MSDVLLIWLTFACKVVLEKKHAYANLSLMSWLHSRHVCCWVHVKSAKWLDDTLWFQLLQFDCFPLGSVIFILISWIFYFYNLDWTIQDIWRSQSVSFNHVRLIDCFNLKPVKCWYFLNVMYSPGVNIICQEGSWNISFSNSCIMLVFYPPTYQHPQT